MNTKSFGRNLFTLALAILGSVAIQHGALTTSANAQDEELEFDVAEFFIEVNGTDGDAGVQLQLDGEGWKSLLMKDPNGATILNVVADGNESIGMQGLTEFFFESAEPSFDDQTLAELFALFPAGEYQFEGVTTEGEPITGTTELTHNIPAIPDPTVKVHSKHRVKIMWDKVKDEFDDPNGAPVGDEIVIMKYRVIVQALDEEEEALHTLDIDLPACSRCISIPEEFLTLSPVGQFKYEVIATEESGNQTIFEDEFDLKDNDNGPKVRPRRRPR